MAENDIDVALNRDPGPGEFMWDIQWGPDGDFVKVASFDTAIWVSLFTDKRATPNEVKIPQLRRGWIGDLETPDDPWGSSLYFLDQRRLNTEVLRLASNWSELALAWMVRDNVALRVEASAEAKSTGELDINIGITKPDGQTDTFLTALWENTGA